MPRFPGLDLTDEARSQAEGPAPLSPGRPGGHAPFAGPVARPVPVLAQRDLQAAVDGVVNLVALGESRLGRPNPSDIAAAHRLLRGSTIFRRFLHTGRPVQAWAHGREGDRYRAWIAWNARAEGHLLALLTRRGLDWSSYTIDDVINALLTEVTLRGRLPQVYAQLPPAVRTYIDGLAATATMEAVTPASVQDGRSHVSPTKAGLVAGDDDGALPVGMRDPAATGLEPGRTSVDRTRTPDQKRPSPTAIAAALDASRPSPTHGLAAASPCLTGGANAGALGPCGVVPLEGSTVDPTTPDPVAMHESGPSGGRALRGMVGGLDPRHVELASWMDPSNPCWGIDPAFLFSGISAPPPPSVIPTKTWDKMWDNWNTGRIKEVHEEIGSLVFAHKWYQKNYPAHPPAIKTRFALKNAVEERDELLKPYDKLFKGTAHEDEWNQYKKAWKNVKDVDIPPPWDAKNPPLGRPDPKANASITPGGVPPSSSMPVSEGHDLGPCLDAATVALLDCLVGATLGAAADMLLGCKNDSVAPIDCVPGDAGCIDLLDCSCFSGGVASADGSTAPPCPPECSGIAASMDLSMASPQSEEPLDCSACEPDPESGGHATDPVARCEWLPQELFDAFGCAVTDPAAVSAKAAFL